MDLIRTIPQIEVLVSRVDADVNKKFTYLLTALIG